jgi:L-gulono-1,4-lactone dehydrogenase
MVAVRRSVRRSSWQNWSGDERCAPAAFERPATEEELVAAVVRAGEEGHRVKVAGSGHSFTAAACTDGHLVALDRYADVVAVDHATARVTVQAGITLRALNEALAGCGLALPNLGDIDAQTVSGAIATSTHGTGATLGGLATQVVAMRLVTAAGDVLDLSPTSDPAAFTAAQVGLGALGAVSTVTLQCVPAFELHAVEAMERIDEVLEDLDAHVDGNDHFEVYWVPHTGWALTKRNNRTDRPHAPRPRRQQLVQDVLVQNIGFGAVCRLARRRPGTAPRLARALPNLGTIEYVDRSDRVFTSPRWVRFTEMEYAVPREAGAEALRRVRDAVHRLGLQLTFPVEARWVAADDIPLSTASGRATCYVAVHVYRGMPSAEYFLAVERIMDDLDGRPHWGKRHFQSAATLAPRYPGWDTFGEVRARLDPDGRFANAYTDRVLGPVGG